MLPGHGAASERQGDGQQRGLHLGDNEDVDEDEEEAEAQTRWLRRKTGVLESNVMSIPGRRSDLYV